MTYSELGREKKKKKKEKKERGENVCGSTRRWCRRLTGTTRAGARVWAQTRPTLPGMTSFPSSSFSYSFFVVYTVIVLTELSLFFFFFFDHLEKGGQRCRRRGNNSATTTKNAAPIFGPNFALLFPLPSTMTCSRLLLLPCLLPCLLLFSSLCCLLFPIPFVFPF